jgi:hypothetical protein
MVSHTKVHSVYINLNNNLEYNIKSIYEKCFINKKWLTFGHIFHSFVTAREDVNNDVVLINKLKEFPEEVLKNMFESNVESNVIREGLEEEGIVFKNNYKNINNFKYSLDKEQLNEIVVRNVALDIEFKNKYLATRVLLEKASQFSLSKEELQNSFGQIARYANQDIRKISLEEMKKVVNNFNQEEINIFIKNDIITSNKELLKLKDIYIKKKKILEF